MTQTGAAYQGDEVVERLLRKAGSPYGAADLAGLLAGVAGAPEAADPEAWIDLVASKLDVEVRALSACRLPRAFSTWPSIRFRAAPTWPTSVRGSASGTRSGSLTSPLASGN